MDEKGVKNKYTDTPHISILSLKIGQMVDMLVTDPPEEEPSETGFIAPGTSSLESLERLTIRPTTS